MKKNDEKMKENEEEEFGLTRKILDDFQGFPLLL